MIENVWSSYLRGGTFMLSGTSMAAPFVAGVAALYKAARGNAAFPTIQGWLHTHAGAKVINLPAGSANRLLYKSTL